PLLYVVCHLLPRIMAHRTTCMRPSAVGIWRVVSISIMASPPWKGGVRGSYASRNPARVRSVTGLSCQRCSPFFYLSQEGEHLGCIDPARHRERPATGPQNLDI